MCLILNSATLPKVIHDSVMSCLESPAGQNAKEFADALFRTTLADGRNTLEACHREGLIKKIQTSQVVVTPNANNNIRLDELNKILNEMAQGEDAIKRLADLDKPHQKTKAPAEARTTSGNLSGDLDALPIPPDVSPAVLTDSDIAKTQFSQAARMKAEAQALLNEATRLEQEARTLDPTINNATQETQTA